MQLLLRRRTRWLCALVATGVTLASLAALTAPTAGASNGVVVNLAACAFGGGTTTVPSGVPITIHDPGYAQGTYGLIKDFLLKEHTTLTVGDGTTTVYDLSSEWGAPQLLGTNFWVTRLPDTDLGIALTSGQSIVATFDITFAKPLLVAYPPVGSSGDNGPFLIREDGPLSCEITAT